MTDERPLRGPDFLPYSLPPAPVTPAPVSAPPPPVRPGRGRWETALDGVPLLGVVSIASGTAGLILLALLSWLADRPRDGALVVTIAAIVSIATGARALRATLPKDSRTLIQLGQAVGVGSALVAIVVWVAEPPHDANAVDPPNPVQTPSSAPSQQPSQAPQPTPGPSLSTAPGAVNGFGSPSTPGTPTSQDPTALGTLYGHVVDASGQPIAGATVTITRADPKDVSNVPDCPTRVVTQTDKTGVYRQQLCQLGDDLGYSVTISVPGATPAHSVLYINSGNTTVYDVILAVKHG